MLRQIIAVTVWNLAAVRGRLWASLVVVVGIGGVVFVLVALLAMANGLRGALASTGDADRVLLLGAGSNSEINGSVTRDQVAILRNEPGIARVVVRGASQQSQSVALLSAEIYASANLQRLGGKGRGSLPMRGVSMDAFRVRPEVHIVAGRSFRPGHFEMLIGRGASRIFAGVAIGDVVPIKDARWRVVGEFVANGSATESEAWVDVDVMASVFRRGAYLNSITARLQSSDSLTRLRQSIEADRRLANALFRESDFYAMQSESVTRTIRGVGFVAGAIMSLGAVFAALNTMYAAVASRTREIAVLKSIGFALVAVVASVMVEALLLAVLGGVVGATLAWLVFDGVGMSALGGAYAQLAFKFNVTPQLVAAALALAALLGGVGGLLPALRAARLSVVVGLRARLGAQDRR